MESTGRLTEMILMDGMTAARILCAPPQIPSPGQYLLAADRAGNSPLASALFSARLSTEGFVAEPPLPPSWQLGTDLALRGPLGHGFSLPSSARRVALIAWDGMPRRLLALIDAALAQQASLTLVCSSPVEDLPLQIEVQPRRALTEVCRWSDYAAFDVDRESLASFRSEFDVDSSRMPAGNAEVLVRAPMPCGGLADCGACAVPARRGTRLACLDGPVVEFGSLFPER